MGASGLLPPVPPKPPSALVIGANGLLGDAVGEYTAPPSAPTVLPTAVTTPPRLPTTGAWVAVMALPPLATAPPNWPSSELPGEPRPVVAPTVCVPPVSCEVIGTMAVLSCCVSCCTGPVDSAVPSVPPPLAKAWPTCVTTPASGVVTGASGASGPVPRLFTSVPALVTVLPVPVTTLPRLDTVVPTGSGLRPMLPRPFCTPVPSAETVVPTLSTTPPRPLCTPLSCEGSGAFLMSEPIPLTVEPAAVTTLPVLLRITPAGVRGAGAGVGEGDGDGDGEGEGEGDGEGEGEGAGDGVGVEPPVLLLVPPVPLEPEPPNDPPISPEPELAQPPRTNRLAIVAARHLMFLFMIVLPF